MLKFSDLEKYGAKYKEVARMPFISKNEAKTLKEITVEERVNKEDGNAFLVMCFYYKTGETSSHYLSKMSDLTKGDNVSPDSVEVVELTNGSKTIYRLDGEVLDLMKLAWAMG